MYAQILMNIMKSLFDQNNSKEIICRINNLKPDSEALWGRMNVAQMLTHVQTPLMVLFGEMKLKRGLIGMLFGSIAKKQLTGEKPFKQNLPTAPKFVVSDSRNFEEEKKKIINMIERFTSLGEKSIANKNHPFFGNMTTEEWDNLQWKHLDHHLRQFGA